MTTTRPDMVTIYDSFDDAISVSPSPDGMTVLIDVVEFDGNEENAVCVSLTPDKALRLAHALRNAQMYVEEAY